MWALMKYFIHTCFLEKAPEFELKQESQQEEKVQAKCKILLLFSVSALRTRSQEENIK